MHTPGPWNVERHTFGWNIGHGIHVGLIAANGKINVHESEANANLTAAAPDMLAALVEARRLLRVRTNLTIAECRFLDSADAAIAKARGE